MTLTNTEPSGHPARECPTPLTPQLTVWTTSRAGCRSTPKIINRISQKLPRQPIPHLCHTVEKRMSALCAGANRSSNSRSFGSHTSSQRLSCLRPSSLSRANPESDDATEPGSESRLPASGQHPAPPRQVAEPAWTSQIYQAGEIHRTTLTPARYVSSRFDLHIGASECHL